MDKLFEAKRYAKQISAFALFNDVPSELMKEWLSSDGCSVCEYAIGTYLLKRNSHEHRLGILLRGSADVTRKCADGKMHMSTLHKNDILGAAALFNGDAQYVVDICARNQTRVLWINEAHFLKMLRDSESLLQNYLRYLNGRIRYLNNRLDALSKNTVAARIYTFLCAEAKNDTYTAESYTTLSDSLCISRATLYRGFDSLIADGKILRIGKKITLLKENTK